MMNQIKNFMLIIITIILIILCSCERNSNNIPKTDTSISKAHVPSVSEVASSSLVTVQNKTVIDAYKAVLQNDENFYSTNLKKDLELNNLYQTITADTSIPMLIDKFAVIDLDNDNTPEIVLSLIMGGYLGSEILYYQNETVYGYTLSNRQFGGLKSDGTFAFSSGANNYGIATISFDRANYFCDQVAYCITNTDFSDASGISISYFVNKKDAVIDEFNIAFEQWKSKSDAIFYDFNQSNIDVILLGE